MTVLDIEKKAAIRSDLTLLNKAAKEKEGILQKLSRLEDQRIDLVKNLAKALGYGSDDLTITMISRLVDEPLASRLRRSGAELSTLLKALKEANHGSRQLCAHSLKLLKNAFNVLTELTSSETVYFPTGIIQRNYPSGKCVNGAI
jgi:flagellar biosynthesis/type III secretory pathway chaperone